MSFSPDGERIVTGEWGPTAKVWDARTARRCSPQGAHRWLTSASFSPDGSRIVTGSMDATANIWDATPINRELLGRESATGAETEQ